MFTIHGSLKYSLICNFFFLLFFFPFYLFLFHELGVCLPKLYGKIGENKTPKICINTVFTSFLLKKV